jgi:hypothetical protein
MLPVYCSLLLVFVCCALPFIGHWLFTQCVNKRELNSVELNYYINMLSPKRLFSLQ